MWHVESPGHAHWRDKETRFSLHARGGPDGISIRPSDSGVALVRFEPVAPSTLPTLGEQFVRGDSLHLSFPEKETPYGLTMVLRVVETSPHRWVLETTIAIETSLLESHPTLDIAIGGSEYRRTTPELERLPGVDLQRGAGAISQLSADSRSVAVLLGQRDFPGTLDLSNDREMRLRLFGEFLEKGVIRKARPWIVCGTQGNQLSEESLIESWRELGRMPLPLIS